MKAGVLRKLEAMYDKEATQELIRIATFLDPRYRSDHQDKLQETQNTVEQEMAALWRQPTQVRVRVEDEEEEEPAPPPKKKKVSLGSLLAKGKRLLQSLHHQ